MPDSGSGVAPPASRAIGAANVQGELHVPGFMGDDGGKRKKKKLRKFNILSDFEKTAKKDKAEVGYTDEAKNHDEQCRKCEHYDAGSCELVKGSIAPGGWCELFERTDMKINKIGARNSRKDLAMIQQMHDNACALGANCHGLAGYDEGVDKVARTRICKIDETMGLVFGYAIVCKVNGEDYWDLNIDKVGDRFERVPEHIPESSMLKAAVDFMQTARAGNEMHAGADVGQYVFAFPMTTEIAKAFGIHTNTTGLMVAYKPSPEVFAKFKDGTYKGFSIEGKRVAAKMLDE